MPAASVLAWTPVWETGSMVCSRLRGSEAPGVFGYICEENGTADWEAGALGSSEVSPRPEAPLRVKLQRMEGSNGKQT